MSFLSITYLLFLAVTALLWYLLPAGWKRPALLALSWGFYLLLGPACGAFLLLSTLSTYACGRLTERSRQRLWPVLTLLLNFGVLFLLKYTGFFLSLGARALRFAGFAAEAPELRLLLPVGISFYTFQSAGYVIDVWRGTVPAEKNFVDYALFVSFFPQLSSGPIGRAGALLPQLKRPPRFSDADLKTGCLRILWGFVKKLLVADHLSVAVNAAFGAVYYWNGGQLAAAVLCLAFQIYCDFSAYTDIAIGSARILGLELTENFRSPYLATSVKDFWRRWHISLSTWFRDYLYIPLGGSRAGRARTVLNVLIVFAVSGLWHGAALTFVLCGLLHGLFQAAGMLLRPAREALYRRIPRESLPMRLLRILGTFLLVTGAWVFFRAGTVTEALHVLKECAVWLTHPYVPAVSPLGLERKGQLVSGVFLLLVCAVDVLREKRDVSAWLRGHDAARYAVYFVLIAAMLLYGYYGRAFDPQEFLYFKF